MVVSIDSELSALDRRMTALRVDYERFFSGDLKQPPLVARRELEQFLRRLGNSEIDRAVDRFRLHSMEGRYNALRELWEKRLTAREQGRTLTGRPLAPEAPAALDEAPVDAAAARSSSATARPADPSGRTCRSCATRNSRSSC